MTIERKIYPDDWARELMDSAGQPYRPGNGDEGEVFDSAWCNHCIHDSKYRDSDDPAPGSGCIIIAQTMSFDKDDPRYPKEWQYRADGQPCCTKFQEKPRE